MTESLSPLTDQTLTIQRNRAKLLQPQYMPTVPIANGKAQVVGLWDWIKAVYGYRVPRWSVCKDEGHVAPLEFISDCFFEKKTDLIGHANRRGSKTLLMAITHFLNSHFRPGCYTVHAGGTEPQAQRCYEHLRSICQSGFAKPYIQSCLVKKTIWLNGSVVETVPATENALSGASPAKVAADEIDSGWEPYLLDQFWGMLTDASYRNIMTQAYYISTWHKPYGMMAQLIDQAATRGIAYYSWCVFDCMQPCKECEKSKCPLWDDCQGRVINADGWMTRQYVIDQKNRYCGSRAYWESAWLCRKASTEGAFFPEFSREFHIRPYELRRDREIYLGYDHGYAPNPCAILFAQLDDFGNIIVFDELVLLKTTVSEQAKLIKEKGYPDPYAGFCDPSAPSVIDTWSEHLAGMQAAPGGERFISTEMVRERLRDANNVATLFITPNCTHLIEEIERAHYPEPNEGVVAVRTDMISRKCPRDCVDSLRYLVAGLTLSMHIGVEVG